MTAIVRSSSFAALGLALCLAASQVSAAVPTDQKLFADYAKWQEREMLPFAELTRNLDEVNLSGVLTLVNITTPDGLIAARATTAHFSSLLAERRRLIHVYLSDLDKFIKAIPPGPRRDFEVKSVEADRPALISIYADMDRAETDVVVDMTAILDWAAEQVGRLAVKDNHLAYVNVQQHEEMKALMVRMNASNANLTSVLAKTVALQTAKKAQLDADKTLTQRGVN